MSTLSAEILRQRGSLYPWVPVCLAVGIALYFGLSQEPTRAVELSIKGGAVLALVIAWRANAVIAPVFWAICLVCAGFSLAHHRANTLAAPVIGWMYYGPVEGRIIGIDRSASDAVRLTLDQVGLARVSPERTPERVRVSLHGFATEFETPKAGARVMTTAHISPPGGPVEPGGFDFQRHAWFLKLGGVGYTRVPVLDIEDPQPSDASAWIFRIRMALSERIRAALPGDTGGFAAAVTTGDRSGISQDGLRDLRASNLAHLLAISGLHMGLLTGFIYGALRLGFALIPRAALSLPTRKVSAGAALAVGAVYLALSGGNVATERAFIMVAVALCALMLGRRVLSLRAVATAAILVLLMRPEALLGPGFQMSFAATTALVAIFSVLRGSSWAEHKWPRWIRPVVAVVFSSGIAGFATAPVAAAHFNVFSNFGLFANIVSVPIMGALIIPAAVLAACLAPLGLADLGLWIMEWGLRWILFVADTTANMPGARGFVQAPDPIVLPMMALGALFVVLWQGRARLLGAGPVLAAFVLWSSADRPDVLIAQNGGLLGVVTDEGRALSKAKGAGFAASIWLENDGDGSNQLAASERWPDRQKGRAQRIEQGGHVFWHLAGKRAAAALEACSGAIVISSVALAARDDCTIFDPERLEATGALALRFTRDGEIETTTAREIAGDRLWSQWPEDRPDQYVRINPTKVP